MAFKVGRTAIYAALLGTSVWCMKVNAEAQEEPKLTKEKLAQVMQMDLEEINSRMKILFDLIDENKDGVIDEEEAKKWSLKIKEAMHKHQVALEFQSIDKNSDGAITMEELIITYTEGSDPKQAEAHKQEVERRFKAVDKNNDGSLSLEEVSILMDPGSDEELMKIEIEEIMAVQDKNSDGKISLDEFLTTEGGTLTAQERDELEQEFKNYDLDNDGTINVSELQVIIKDPHAHEMRMLMEKFLKHMENGKITKEHWENNFDTFAVSMLTDNGELLRFPGDYSGLNLPFKSVLSQSTDMFGGLDDGIPNHEEL